MFSANTSSEVSRRQLLKGLAAFSASVALAGCNKSSMISSGSPVSVQSSASNQPVPTGAVTSGSLSISSNVAGSIASDFAGFSYEKSMLTGPLFSGTNDNLISLFRLVGQGVLRIGGNSVDQCVWTPGGAGRTAGQIAPSDVDALASFLAGSGWRCIYGINLGGAATGATTPELAAAEVAYVSKKLGSSLIGIEIGNECEGYGAAGGYFAGNWSLAQFEALWNQFRAAITIAVPDVAFIGPASGASVSTWTIPFGQACTRKSLSMVTQHYYRGDGKATTSTAANLLTTDSNLARCTSLLSAAAQQSGIPFRFGECNSYYNGGAVGVSNSYASSLWIIDFLFNSALGGAAGVNLHGGGNYTGYTPIADKNGVVVEVRPEFYGLMMFALAGQGSMYQTSLSVNGVNATAYAVKDSSGALNLVIVNKDENQNLQLSVSLPQKAASASLISMTQNANGVTGPSLSATSGVTIQDATISTSGSFSPAASYSLSAGSSQVSCYVPALSAVLVKVTF
jgi:hypothetical protein